MTDKIFARGFIVKTPNENAPDFIKARFSIKTEEFIPFLESHTKGDGWCNLTLKESKGGKWYVELDSWVKPGPMQNVEDEGAPSEEDSPF